MTKPGDNFQVPDEMRTMLEQGVTKAREGFEKVMNVAGEAVGTLETKSDSAQSQLADMRRKSLAFTETSIGAAFDLAQKLVGARSLDEVMKLQAEYLKNQFEAVRDQVQEAGKGIQSQTRAAAEEMMAESAKLQAKAKEAIEQGVEAVKKAATQPKK